MAVTKIWGVRDGISKVLRYTANPLKTGNTNFEEAASYHAVEQTLLYTANEMKTEQQFYVSGINCDSDPGVACRQFMHTKKHYGKTGGILCFHAIQSFQPGELTPELAHAIGIELAGRMWGDRFEVVVSTHLNTRALHNHFCINSVSFWDGLRYYDQKATYAKLRETSDEICREFGLSVIERPQRSRSRHIGEIKAEDDGRYTVRGQIRHDLDFAISQNISWKFFTRTFENLGYLMERRGKYLRVRPDGSARFFRLDKLGDGYTEQQLRERLDANFRQSRSQRMKQYHPLPREKPKGLYALFLYYEYLVGNLPKTKPENPVAYETIKADSKRARMYSEEAKLLGKYKIDTVSELKDLTVRFNTEHKELAIQRSKLWNQLRRLRDAEKIKAIKEQIYTLTDRMGVIRKELHYCEDIAIRSGAVEEVVNCIFEPLRESALQKDADLN